MAIEYNLLITANPFSDSKAAIAVFKIVRQLDLVSGDIKIIMPGFHLSKSEKGDTEEIVRHKINRMHENIKACDSDYHGDEAIFHIYCEYVGDMYFNDVDFYKFMSDMTDDCPNIEYVGRTELVVLPVEDGNILYEEVRSFDLEPFVENYIADCSLKQFLLSVINILKRHKKKGEYERLETLNRIESFYVDKTKSYKDYEFTEVTIKIDNAIFKHMKWSGQCERFFISYSTRNEREAYALRDLLKEKSKDVWMAPEGIPVPMSYLCVVPAAIRITTRFIVLLSDASANSIWVKREIEKAIKINRRIDVILVGGFTTERIQEYESLDFLLSQVQVRYSIKDLLDNETVINELLNN